MRRVDDSFWRVASQALEQGTRVLALERIAYGAGATRWFLLEAPADVQTVSSWLRPGSQVQLFVDPAIAVEGIAANGLLGALADTLAAIEPTVNDLVALTRSKDGPLCAHEFLDPGEVAPWLDEQAGGLVLFRHYPQPGESDAEGFVPDADGVVRGGPH